MNSVLNLQQLEEYLSQFPKDRVAKYGLSSPHSFRGQYNDVAFEPAANVTIESMLACIREAYVNEFIGHTGGTFRYGPKTPVHIALCGVTFTSEYENQALYKIIMASGGIDLD